MMGFPVFLSFFGIHGTGEKYSPSTFKVIQVIYNFNGKCKALNKNKAVKKKQNTYWDVHGT